MVYILFFSQEAARRPELEATAKRLWLARCDIECLHDVRDDDVGEAAREAKAGLSRMMKGCEQPSGAMGVIRLVCCGEAMVRR